MTVSYQYDVASSSTGGFFRLLWRWRGSIWKLLYKELLLFVIVYLCIAFSYDFLMTDYYKRYYERIVIFCSAFVEIIPLSFILGFYVSFTATRWWQQYTAIPWPDKLMNIIALYVPGNDVTSRVLRRTLMRYLNLTLVLVLRSISIPVKRRFPTKEHLVEAGFMSRPELEMYSSVPSHEFNTFWIPCTWFVNLLREAKSECRITDSGGIKLIMEEFNDFRSKCGLLWSYDWVSIPLVYTQVVTLSTQAFFLASLLGRQHIHPPKDQNDVKSHVYGEYYIPIFTLLQFILYMGLLKLGEQLINPFGDDDEDFELNWIIDRHLKVSFLGVDILNSDPPPLIKDNYFDEMDIKLPYTEAAVAHKVKTYRGSVAAFHVPSDKHALVIPEFADEHCDDEDECCSTIQSQRDNTSHQQRQSTWNLFNRPKRKLSSSLDSFNSETMVELGISEEREVPKLQPNSSWSSFLAEHHKGTSGVDDAKMPNWTPSKLQQQHSEQQSPPPPPIPGIARSVQVSKATGPITATIPSGPGLHRPSLDQLKQSSFSTSTDSSVITDQHLEGSSSAPRHHNLQDYHSHQFTQKRRESLAKLQFPRLQSPLHVYSKEFADAPMRIFNTEDAGGGHSGSIPGTSTRNQGDRSSLSSVSIKSFQGGSGGGGGSSSGGSGSSKPHKSLMKCHRSVDPHLRIRPFRSKVTFSEDTKAGDNTDVVDKKHSRLLGNATSGAGSCGGSGSTFYLGWDSSNESIIRSTGATGPGSRTGSDSAMHHAHYAQHDRACSPFTENQKRRQSLDPSICRLAEEVVQPPLVKPPTQEQENWLHYQSLPNIQEEESLSTAQTPTESPPNSSGPHQKEIPELSLEFASPEPPKSPVEPTGIGFLTPNPPPDEPSGTFRRKSIKRQKSTDLADEDLKLTKLPPPPLATIGTSSTARPLLSKKQSSSDSNNSSNSKVMGILKNGSTSNNRKQASTESDTGSYHTVNSLYIGKPPSNSSSVDSFTSAIDDSSASGSASAALLPALNRQPLKTGNGSDVLKPSVPQLQPPPAPPQAVSSVPFAPSIVETGLVPKIVFSASTPSVTSQSSDDQNSSPRWDHKYSSSGFGSSHETIKEQSPQQTRPPSLSNQHPRPTVPPSTKSAKSSESLFIEIGDVDNDTRPRQHPEPSFSRTQSMSQATNKKK